MAQATCRAKAGRAYLQSAAPVKHLTLPVRAVMPNYPELRWSRATLHASTRPAAAAKHLTLPAHIVMLGPHVKRKDDGAEPGFEPGTLRLLAVRSNH